MKSYKELRQFTSFDERFNYLRIGGSVGEATFGFERYLNQNFYRSDEWQATRNGIIVRDNGCDLGLDDFEIFGRVTVHHINPITIDDIREARDCVLDPNNLICTSHETHLAIHYGNQSMLSKLPRERSKGDMCPWLT